MSEVATNIWSAANQRHLMASLAIVRAALVRHIASSQTDATPSDNASAEEEAAAEALRLAAAAMPSPSALEILCHVFNLSVFERDLLLLCAGIELDPSLAGICAKAQGDPARSYPTFSLALAALPDAHWSALTPSAPLRRWRLIEFGSGLMLTARPLRIDERILHYLAGVQHLDERLSGLIEPLAPDIKLAPSHQALAERVASSWSHSAEAPLPIAQLCGNELADKRAIAVAACTSMGLQLASISATVIPTGASEWDGFLSLWSREALLRHCALLVECDDVDGSDVVRANAINRLIDGLDSPLIISSVERRAARHKPILTFDVSKPSAGEQKQMWEQALNGAPIALNGHVGALVSQFNLNLQKVRAATAEATMQLSGSEPADFERGLWDACRRQARSRLDDLAQRIEPVAAWGDLVLPVQQLQTLSEIAVHVRHRMTVYETWGFATKGLRGLGISALFSGVSGTGKTMAAEVLANELRLDLYRIDLSAVVSKYIGETEKNLRRVFDAAEEGGAILLFDEADALFGKRTEVKDSHDRYANIEVSYLLQRVEAYRGLAILTTNLKSALDTAFLRRIRFILSFPFPDLEQRAEIWRRIFPNQTPTRALDFAALARLNVAGGNIRNIAMNAAFLAANADEPVSTRHLLRSAQGEYSKLERSLTEGEIRGWV